MIKVNRNSVEVPTVMIGDKCLAKLEREAVCEFYSKPENANRSFASYRVYKHDTVKSRLNELFKNKCAYCEINYSGAPFDVEHFRPKGAIVEINLKTFLPIKNKVLKPGYFWLAAEWTNLFPTCIDCNRRREHEFDELAIAKGLKRKQAGKANFFPLEKRRRVRAPHEDVDLVEKRLLLNPCVDNPEDHLEYGDRGVIRPKLVLKKPSVMGRTTIAILGLQRDLLVRRREEWRSLLLFQVEDALGAIKALQKNSKDSEAEKNLNKALNVIRTRFLIPSAPFLGMSRQIVSETISPRP